MSPPAIFLKMFFSRGKSLSSELDEDDISLELRGVDVDGMGGVELMVVIDKDAER